jgi:hypothetical protein
MLGLKNVGHTAITIAGVELLHRMRKNQFCGPELVADVNDNSSFLAPR